MTLGLSQIREIAVLILYLKEFNPQMTTSEGLDYIYENHQDIQQPINYEEVTEEDLEKLKQEGLSPLPVEAELKPVARFSQMEKPKTVPPYLEDLVEGVAAKKEDLDRIIDAHIKGNWSVDRLEAVNLEILRVAVYEMYYTPDSKVPDLVALDEALNLAKLYSDDKSRKFINGVLSSVMADKESQETGNNESED